MPLTISNFSGDGVTSPRVDTFIQLPDSGTNVLIAGSVDGLDSAALGPVAVTGSPLTMPTTPVSGSVFWNIQVDLVTGAATVQQSTVADPALLGPTAMLVFRQTLTSTSTDPAIAGSDSTPDTW